MDAELTWEGSAAFDAALDNWVRESILATSTGTKAAAKGVIDMAKSHINSQSGKLARSLRSEVKADGLNGYTATIGPQGLAYARRVELGKRKPNGAMSHPYLRPGYEKAMSAMTEAFATAWRAASPKG